MDDLCPPRNQSTQFHALAYGTRAGLGCPDGDPGCSRGDRTTIFTDHHAEALEQKDRIVDWARKYCDDLHRYSEGGAYVNFMMEEGEERFKASYRDNYERLTTIKRTYGPTNFFRVNQNIMPTI